MGAIEDLTVTVKTIEDEDYDLIDLTGFDLRTLARKVYELSRPQGLGILHYQEGSLPDEELEEVIDVSERSRLALTMDYVLGRACKFHVQLAGDSGYLLLPDGVTHWIRTDWYDHFRPDLEELLSACRPDTDSAGA